jgi:hypothetical protein
MPIRKEHQDRYPVDWQEIAFLLKESNFWQCQECNRQCLRPGDSRDGLSRAERTRRTLTIAHYQSTYDAPEILLLCLCAGCHIRHDLEYHLAARHRNERRRRRQAGQMVLFANRSSRCTRADLASLEAMWPGHEYLDTLEDGIDWWGGVEP